MRRPRAAVRFAGGSKHTGTQAPAPHLEEGTVFASNFVAATQQSASPLLTLVPLILMVGLLYMLMIRPQQRKAKAQRALQSAVEPGDEVVTIGGIYGEVSEVDDETVVVEIADGVEVRFVRSAIARKLVFQDEAQHVDGPGIAAKDKGTDDAS
jgi:preprotein translocase subunit YajC